MQIAVSHSTHYRFDQPPAHGLQRLRLRPKSTHGQQVLGWTMAVDGGRVEAEYDDHNHNHTALLSITPGARDVTITCKGLIETSDHAGIIGQHSGFMPLWCFCDATPLTKPGAQLRSLAHRFNRADPDRLGQLHALSEAVRETVQYETGFTDATTSAEAALVARHGVCQDHAHIFITVARLLGTPARYVSGYLLMDDRIEQQAGHAWAEAHIPDLGWVGFDISNVVSPDERYIRVATGRDYRDAAPVTGLSQGAGNSALEVNLAIEQQQAAQ